MSTFWLKIAALGVIVIIAVVLLVNFMSSGIEQATDIERMEKLAAAQEARLQAELAEAERQAEQAKAEQTQPERVGVEQPTMRPEPSKPQPDEFEQLEQNVQAQRLYQMAEAEFKIARKPLMTPKRCVDYCREIIRKWPNSAEAAKARVLLRKLPERYRKMYNITDEEMGISK